MRQWYHNLGKCILLSLTGNLTCYFQSIKGRRAKTKNNARKQNAPARVGLHKITALQRAGHLPLSRKMLTSTKTWARFAPLDSLKHDPLSAQVLVATFQPSRLLAELQIGNSTKIQTWWHIGTEILSRSQAVLAFSSHECSNSQQATFPPTEATPFHYKTAATADTCSPRRRVTSRQYHSRSETRWHVTCRSLLCVASILTTSKNNTASVVSLPPPKMKLFLASSSFPPGCPRFLT